MVGAQIANHAQEHAPVIQREISLKSGEEAQENSNQNNCPEYHCPLVPKHGNHAVDSTIASQKPISSV